LRGGDSNAKSALTCNYLVRRMRAEIQAIVDDIKQSIGLLRRHL
jgi:hypothetical protein